MPTRDYGIALAGAGSIARIHAAAIADIPNAHLVGVCDMAEAACRSLAETVGGIFWTTDIRELVSRGDVDIVSICTPSGTHADLAVIAAQAGKHLGST